ncbi:hypothetical protein C8F01DRAFT_1255897 [Mycena amicta]|nr:hypothetical protein C8F01DRAFT_1255897 [Mycena amicta]
MNFPNRPAPLSPIINHSVSNQNVSFPSQHPRQPPQPTAFDPSAAENVRPAAHATTRDQEPENLDRGKSALKPSQEKKMAGDNPAALSSSNSELKAEASLLPKEIQKKKEDNDEETDGQTQWATTGEYLMDLYFIQTSG